MRNPRTNEYAFDINPKHSGSVREGFESADAVSVGVLPGKVDRAWSCGPNLVAVVHDSPQGKMLSTVWSSGQVWHTQKLDSVANLHTAGMSQLAILKSGSVSEMSVLTPGGFLTKVVSSEAHIISRDPNVVVSDREEIFALTALESRPLFKKNPQDPSWLYKPGTTTGIFVGTAYEVGSIENGSVLAWQEGNDVAVQISRGRQLYNAKSPPPLKLHGDKLDTISTTSNGACIVGQKSLLLVNWSKDRPMCSDTVDLSSRRRKVWLRQEFIWQAAYFNEDEQGRYAALSTHGDLQQGVFQKNAKVPEKVIEVLSENYVVTRTANGKYNIWLTHNNTSDFLKELVDQVDEVQFFDGNDKLSHEYSEIKPIEGIFTRVGKLWSMRIAEGPNLDTFPVSESLVTGGLKPILQCYTTFMVTGEKSPQYKKDFLYYGCLNNAELPALYDAQAVKLKIDLVPILVGSADVGTTILGLRGNELVKIEVQDAILPPQEHLLYLLNLICRPERAAIEKYLENVPKLDPTVKPKGPLDELVIPILQSSAMQVLANGEAPYTPRQYVPSIPSVTAMVEVLQAGLPKSKAKLGERFDRMFKRLSGWFSGTTRSESTIEKRKTASTEGKDLEKRARASLERVAGALDPSKKGAEIAKLSRTSGQFLVNSILRHTSNGWWTPVTEVAARTTTGMSPGSTKVSLSRKSSMNGAPAIAPLGTKVETSLKSLRVALNESVLPVLHSDTVGAKFSYRFSEPPPLQIEKLSAEEYVRRCTLLGLQAAELNKKIPLDIRTWAASLTSKPIVERLMAIEEFYRDQHYDTQIPKEIRAALDIAGPGDRTVIMKQRLNVIRATIESGQGYKGTPPPETAIMSGICADIASEVVGALSAAGVYGAVMAKGYVDEDGVISEDRAHAIALVPFPAADGRIDWIEVDGTPPGVSARTGRAMPRLPPLAERVQLLAPQVFKNESAAATDVSTAAQGLPTSEKKMPEPEPMQLDRVNLGLAGQIASALFDNVEVIGAWRRNVEDGDWKQLFLKAYGAPHSEFNSIPEGSGKPVMRAQEVLHYYIEQKMPGVRESNLEALKQAIVLLRENFPNETELSTVVEELRKEIERREQ